MARREQEYEMEVGEVRRCLKEVRESSEAQKKMLVELYEKNEKLISSISITNSTYLL
jgi:hypothetical protein